MVNLVNERISLTPVAVPATDTLAVANRLRPVLLKLTRELRRESHSLGVTGGQVTLLVAIKSSPGIGVAELASQEGISVPGMSKAVDRLERSGLVVRTQSGADRRRVGLRLSEAGERVLRSVKSKRTAWLAARLRRLDPDELGAVDAAIAPLAVLLGEGS